MAVDPADHAIAFRPQFDARYVGQTHHRSVGLGLEDDVGELRRGRQARLSGDGGVEHLTRAVRRAADFTRRDLCILCGDRSDHVARDQAEACQFVRIEPDAHGILGTEHVGIADALDTADRILEIRYEIIRYILIGRPVRGIVDGRDQQKIRVRFGDRQPLLLDLLRQAGQGLLHLILHLNLCDIRIHALLERRRDRHLPARA